MKITEVLRILNAGMNNKELVCDMDTIKEIVQVFHENSMLQWLYPVFKINELKKYYIAANIINENNSDMVKKITEKFNEANIDHIYMKGIVLKDIYPKSYLRVMGDVDCIIHEKDVEEAKGILEELGLKSSGAMGHHIEYTAKHFNFELHTQMIPDTSKWNDYFTMPFHNATMVDKNLFCLDNNYHLLYIVVHYARHLLSSGAGIRPICDIYVMLKYLEIDYDMLMTEIKKLELNEFWNIILNAINLTFDYKPYDFIDSADTLNFIEFSMNCGTHGAGVNNTIAIVDEKGNKKNKFTYLLSRLFKPKSDMQAMYPFTKCIILLPFGYVLRFFDLIFKKRKKVNKILRQNKEDSTKTNDILNKIGLLK